jgi:hypothetical protein
MRTGQEPIQDAAADHRNRNPCADRVLQIETRAFPRSGIDFSYGSHPYEITKLDEDHMKVNNLVTICRGLFRLGVRVSKAIFVKVNCRTA